MATGLSSLALSLLLAGGSMAGAADLAEHEIKIRSSKDGSEQRSILVVPPNVSPGAGAPLIVSLHSWSANYAKYDSFASTLKGCQLRGWIFLSPDFRGPNNRPEACASDLAVQDVLDAVGYARAHARVDAKRIYLVGASGGGHMALVMAHRAPLLWAGVSCDVPITDVAAFHRHCKTSGLRYAEMTERCFGGPPGAAAIDQEYRRRSPLFFLAAARSIPMDINIGIQDGHNGGAVPADHGLHAFNALARANGHSAACLSEAQIDEITRTASIPAELAGRGADEPSRRYRILLRRVAGPVRLTVFDGGHVWDEGRDSAAEPALDWIASLDRRESR